MTTQAEKYHASMAGEFFVAAQLLRLQIAASVTYGNAKSADVIAFSHETGKAVVVEVKTSTKGRWPVGNRAPAPSDKPWVFVHLPPDSNAAPEFFVMTQEDIHNLLAPIEKACMESYKEKHGKEYGNKPGVCAMTMKLANQPHFKNNWDAIRNALEPKLSVLSSTSKSGPKKTYPSFPKKLFTPSKALADIIGAGPIDRFVAARRLSLYIEKENLRDDINKRMINSDTKLNQLFGKMQVSIFELTSGLNKHLSETRSLEV